MYDPTSGDGGLFAKYMNTFMGLKMEASGYHTQCTSEEDKHDYIDRVRRYTSAIRDSVIHRHVEGLSEFVGGMTDELGGGQSYYRVRLERTQNYAYRTADGKQVVKVKGFR